MNWTWPLVPLLGCLLTCNSVWAQSHVEWQNMRGRLEFTFSAGSSLIRNSANNVNTAGNASHLFDDGIDNLGTIRLEAGYGLSDRWIFGSGLIRASSSDKVVSIESPSNYPVQVDFRFTRTRDQTLLIPFAQLKYLIDNTGRQCYFFVAGTSLGLARTTFRYETDGLVFGESFGERKMLDLFPGLFGAAGFVHAISANVSMGAEFGFRLVDKVDLHGGTREVYIPPYFPDIIVDPFRLRADYSGPYAMVSVTVRP